MQCISPIKAGFNRNDDIVYSTKLADPGQIGFQFECRKCLPCRLNIAREKAIRSTHEAKMHQDNIFITLTYDEQNLESPRLIYEHWQLFIKSLRERVARGIKDKDTRNQLYIPYMVTGEYGEETKRPHWHAILFNYAPQDPKAKYTSDRGDRVFESETLTKLWKRGSVEYGDVTMESASYVARYAAKKLVHGADQDHDYHPIHKTSCKRAIGRSWIEKYHKHTFENGYIVLPNGSVTKIPRYYNDWYKEHHFDKWLKYNFGIKQEIIKKAELQNRKEEQEYFAAMASYKGGRATPQTRPQVRETILKRKFKQLQENLKL